MSMPPQADEREREPGTLQPSAALDQLEPGKPRPASAASPPIVSFRGVEKSYDGVSLVVRDLSLDIARGEFLTLLGPSGSGKTTSLMMLAGFEAPTSGDILLNGRSLTAVPPHRRNIGMVFQSYALFPHLTVEGNLAYPLRMRRMARAAIAPRVERVLAMVRLEAFRQRRPAQLSGGQQQRVALARALVFEPDIVLMDEPLGALDKQLREHMQIEIKHLQRQLGVTVVYVTHDQSEALTMSDRVAVFNAGRIEQVASPAALYEEPCTAFVARFIGENNALRGRVLERDGALCRVAVAEAAVTARVVGACLPGREVILSIRPERVRIAPAGAGMDNSAEAELLEVVYLGDHGRARLRVLGADDFVLKIPVEQLGALPQPGGRFTIGWQAEHCRALDLD